MFEPPDCLSPCVPTVMSKEYWTARSDDVGKSDHGDVSVMTGKDVWSTSLCESCYLTSKSIKVGVGDDADVELDDELLGSLCDDDRVRGVLVGRCVVVVGVIGLMSFCFGLVCLRWLLFVFCVW